MTALIAAGALVLFVVLPWLIWQGPYVIDADHIDDAELKKGSAALVTGLRTAVVAFTAALGAGIALLYTARTYRLTRRGQITDRFTKALERLGSNEIYVRIGGILALEQIVQDAPEQAATDAARVLGHFIRHRAPKTADDDPLPIEPAADVQAALTALTRAESRTHVDPREPLDLHGLYLVGAQLSQADLTEANLSGATLTKANLAEATLTRADLFEVTLTVADLSGATLTGARLGGATLTGAYLFGATLTKAYLLGATLTDADLSGATLTGAYLSGATLTDANLFGATLTDANLFGATLTGARLDRATLTKARLDRATLTKAYLFGATLTDANLLAATLTDADLSGATLTGADLSGATLTNANLLAATLTNADLSGATLTGADLSGANGLAPEQASLAITDETTKMPANFYVSVKTSEAP